MSEVKEIPHKTYNLEFGSTFTDNRRDANLQYHTLRYDFKPRNIGEAEAFIAPGANGDVHVALPASDSDALTVYKGSKQESKGKECLLFFDKNTGTVRIEKISSNINVKKTRDLDPATDSHLRQKMAALRTRPKETSSMAKSPTPARDDTSSSSSSSDSDSASDSDSDGEKSPRQRQSSISSTDEMESQLVASLNDGKAQTSTTSSLANSDALSDMPSFDAAPISAPPKPSYQKPVTKATHGDLGLCLSESSDEDD